MASTAPGLFPPDGFRYLDDLISIDEERALVEEIQKQPLKEFEFHGYTGKRRINSFGWKYDFAGAKLLEAPPIPAFLVSVRDTAANFAGIPAASLVQALVTEYSPGTTIGWHRDKAVFEHVVGISLVSECTFRFRKKAGPRWERYSFPLRPRSVYLLRDEIRNEWEHSIPAVSDARYSVTFRSLRRAN